MARGDCRRRPSPIRSRFGSGASSSRLTRALCPSSSSRSQKSIRRLSTASGAEQAVYFGFVKAVSQEKKEEEPVFIEDEKDGGPETADDKPFEYNHEGLSSAEAQQRLEKLGSAHRKSMAVHLSRDMRYDYLQEFVYDCL